MGPARTFQAPSLQERDSPVLNFKGGSWLILKCQTLVIIMMTIIIVFGPGCSNIREVETGSKVYPELQGREEFVSEEKAVGAVARDPEVKRFAEEVGGQCVFITEHNPTDLQPVYIIQVAGEAGDHWDTCNYFTVNANTGKIIAKEFK